MKPGPKPPPAQDDDRRDAAPAGLAAKFRLPANCRIVTSEEAGKAFGFVGATNFVKAAQHTPLKSVRKCEQAAVCRSATAVDV
jgi:hypothetical protein